MTIFTVLILSSSLWIGGEAAPIAANSAHRPRADDPDLMRAQSKADAAAGGVVPAELWCVAKNNAEDGALQSALDWACGPGGADCHPIQQAGACFEPNDLQFHTSYAFNDYYLRNGVSQQACDFGGTAALTSLDPGALPKHLPPSHPSDSALFPLYCPWLSKRSHFSTFPSCPPPVALWLFTGNKNCHFPSSSSARNGTFTGSTAGTAGSLGLGPAGADMSGARMGARWPCRTLSVAVVSALATALTCSSLRPLC
ncbi:hypothetical protein Taro_010900 [Colocasia esculenta]|uniref:X8 domain-containing protein n=1 Tax=Colocasia esculenta TaxID=4460 RepID=A0A843U4N9_COLES|nr:hypothetical protein [Colocasia esculenta]